MANRLSLKLTCLFSLCLLSRHFDFGCSEEIGTERGKVESMSTGRTLLSSFLRQHQQTPTNTGGYWKESKAYFEGGLMENGTEEENTGNEDASLSIQEIQEDSIINGNWENFTADIDMASRDLSWNLTLEKFYAVYPVDVWKSYGFFDESYLTKINPHWLRFKPASTSSHLVLAFLYGIIMTVGCFGNLLVVFMFFRCRSLRTPANYLIANLAVSDFGMLLKTPVFIINSYCEGPVLGLIGCQVYGFVGGLTGTTSIMTLAVIAIDRYCVIVHPLDPFKKTTHTKAVLMIVGVWLYSGFFSSIPLTFLNGYVSEGYLTSCSFDYLRSDTQSRVFIFIFFLAAWLFPLTSIIFSYISIFRMVAQAEKMEIFQGESQRASFKYRRIKDKMRKDLKIALITTVIVMIWIIAWTPYAAVALLGIFGKKHLITPFISTLPALFCKISSCINPFIYAISHPRFQKELKIKCDKISCCPRLNLLRSSSPRSVSYIASVSENTASNRAKLGEEANDNDDELVSINESIQAQHLTPISISVTNSEGVQNCMRIIDTPTVDDLSLGTMDNEALGLSLEFQCNNEEKAEFKNSLNSNQRTFSMPNISIHPNLKKSFGLCSSGLAKLHFKCKSMSLTPS